LAVLRPVRAADVVLGLAFRALLPDGGVLSIVPGQRVLQRGVVARTVAGLWSHLTGGPRTPRGHWGVAVADLHRGGAAGVGAGHRVRAAVVFLFCATSFGVVLILGGARYRTLETEIYLRTVELLDLSGAAALSLLQCGCGGGAGGGRGGATRRETALRLRGRVETARRPVGGEWAVVALAVGLWGCCSCRCSCWRCAPVSTSDGWGWDGYGRWPGPVSRHAAGVRRGRGRSTRCGWRRTRRCSRWSWVAWRRGAVALAGAGARRSVVETVDAALMLPLGVSAVTVGSLPDHAGQAAR